MPRKPSDQPWFHFSSRYWCATVAGKRVYLAKCLREARIRLRQLRNDRKVAEATGVRNWLQASFAELADEYLEDLNHRRSEATYQANRSRLQRALRIIGATVKVVEIRKFHLAQIEGRLTKDYSPTTVRDTLAAVQAVFSWAVKNDLLESNPLVGYEKPAARGRNRVIETGEFQALLRHSDVGFRRVLIAIRMTGCRPGEIRSLIWPWVDLAEGLWIFPEHKTVTRQRTPRPRIVPLPDPVLKLCRWLVTRPTQDEHVFLNALGKPYSKNCFVHKMARLRKRAGIATKAGERIVMYSNRHTFATDSIGRVSDLELAEVMGHTDTSMLRRYTHISASRLREIRRRLD